MIKQLASAVLWALVGLSQPATADDADAGWADDGTREELRRQQQGMIAEIRDVKLVGVPLADGEERPSAWVAARAPGRRPLAVAAVGYGPEPFIAELQVAFVSVAEPNVARELVLRGLEQARQHGALKVLIDPGAMPTDLVKALAEERGFHFYRMRPAEDDGNVVGTAGTMAGRQLEFLADLYWREPPAK